MRFVRALVFALSALVVGSCGGEEPRNLREWTADDHQQPQQPDPARTPAGEGQGAVEASEEQIAAAAAQLFGATCGGCHGAGGAGDGTAAPTPDMPNMATAEWQAANSDADIARAIRMGQGLMPAYGGQLNERGIAALVGHVRTLGPSPEGEPAPEPAPEE